jgi:hypothetical protein
MVLRYRTETFQETRRGESILSSASQQQALDIHAGARNDRGLLPLRFRLEGTDVAEVFVDQSGQPRDFSLLVQLGSDDAEAIEVALMGFMQGPVAKRFENLRLRLDHPERVNMPFVELMGPFMKPVPPSSSPMLGLSVVYAGHRLIDGARTVELRVSLALRGRGHRVRVRGQDEPVLVNTLEGEVTTHVDTERQFVIRNYQTISVRFRAKGLDLSSRQVGAAILDRTASKGL